MFVMQVEVLEQIGMDRFSASRISSFRKCAYRAAAHYLWGIEDSPSEATVLGKSVHHVLQQAGQHLKDTGKAPAPRTKMVREWVQAAQVEAEKTGLLSKTALADIGKFARRGMPLLENVPVGAEMLVERYFEVPIPGYPGLFFRGYIDLGWITAKTGVICDYKTNRKPYEVMQDPGRQLLLYAWAMSQLYPQVERWVLDLQFLRFDASSQAEVSRDHLQAVEEYLVSQVGCILGRIEANDFPATPGNHCKSCAAAVQCPVVTETPRVTVWDLADARGLFGIWLAMEAKLDLIKGALRSFVEANGPVELNGEWVGLYGGEQELTFPDVPKLIEVLRGLGIDPLDCLKSDDLRLRKMADEHPELVQAGVWKPKSVWFVHRASPPGVEGDKS